MIEYSTCSNNPENNIVVMGYTECSQIKTSNLITHPVRFTNGHDSVRFSNRHYEAPWVINAIKIQRNLHLIVRKDLKIVLDSMK